MFQNFPYTDMHQMNLDWVIKIAKDFLDQYTHIEEVITDGEQGIRDTAEEMENLLQEWYDTHSAEIAQQIATLLANAITTFNNTATATGQAVLATIPADYSSIWATMAKSFDSTKNYNPGDIVKTMDNDGTGHIWRYKTNHTAGVWNASEADEIDLGTAIAEGIINLIARSNITGCPNVFDTPLAVFPVRQLDQGVVYSRKNGGINFYGTCTTNSFVNLYVGNFPDWLEHDKDYFIHFPTSSPINLEFYGYPNSSQSSTTTFFNGRGEGVVNIPTGIEYLRIRVRVEDGQTVNETVYPFMTLVQTNEQLTDVANDIKGLKIVNPDMFPGTDGQKWQRAFNSFGNTGEGVIIVNRDYTLTQDIYIDHQTYYDLNNRITVLGIGEHTHLNMGGYEFRGRATDGVINYGGVTWKNIWFTGTNWVFRSTNLIRIICDNCTFENFKNIVYGTVLMQSYYFINCLIRDLTEPIIKLYNETDSSFYDISFRNNLIERCTKLIDCYRGYNMIFDNNCIEAFHDLPFKIRGYAQNIVIEHNYFEHNNDGFNGGDVNNGGINIDITGVTEAQNIAIRENFFGMEDATGVILLPNANLIDKGTIIITGNDCPWTGVFIKSSETLTEPYSDIYIAANKGTITDTNNLIYTFDKIKTRSISIGSATLKLERIGKTIKVYGDEITINGANGWTAITNGINPIYRPAETKYFIGAEGSNVVKMRMTSSGNLEAYLNDTAAHTMTVDITMLV